MQIYTVGHSTRSLEELVGLLREHGIEALADVRSFPSSKRYPHFHKDVLSQQLPQAGIDYHWFGETLGGYRKKGDPDSPHVALRSPGFRNYDPALVTPAGNRRYSRGRGKPDHFAEVGGVLPKAIFRNRFRESGGEFLFKVRKLDPVLRTFWPGDAGDDAAEVEIHDPILGFACTRPVATAADRARVRLVR